MYFLLLLLLGFAGGWFLFRMKGGSESDPLTFSGDVVQTHPPHQEGVRVSNDPRSTLPEGEEVTHPFAGQVLGQSRPSDARGAVSPEDAGATFQTDGISSARASETASGDVEHEWENTPGALQAAWRDQVADRTQLTVPRLLMEEPSLAGIERADLSEVQVRYTYSEQIESSFPTVMEDKHERRRHSYLLTLLEETADMQTRLRAEALGLEYKGIDAEGRGFTLAFFEEGAPRYLRTMNQSAAESSAADLVRQNVDFDPILGPDLDGSGFFFNINDHGIARQHLEFQLPNGGGSRVMEREPEDHDSHMDHVTGTVGAHGYREDAKGMAPAVRMYSLNQQSSSDVDLLGMRFPLQSRRSIGGTTSLGWSHETGEGGEYDYTGRSFDDQLLETPYYLHFYAAANNGGYNTISNGRAASKNLMTVGSGRHVNRQADGTYISGGNKSGFSSMGPMDDGRIKPDILANGESVRSTTGTSGYSNKQGTSMATPNASGSSILLQDYFSKRFPGHLMKAVTLKNLIVHTADDLGDTGPDYRHGWGFMNTRKAADLVASYADQPGNRRLTEAVLTNGETHDYLFTWDGTSPLVANLAWMDYRGISSSAHDDRQADIKYDLDLRIISPSGSTTYLPWAMPFVLNGFNTDDYDTAAVKADNTVDNVEQVRIGSPTEVGVYTVQISHKGTLESDEPVSYSLILSGVDLSAAAPAPTISSFTPNQGRHHHLQVSVTGTGFLLGANVRLQAPGLEAIEGYAEVVTPTQIEVFLPLDRVPPGDYQLVVENPDGQSVTAAGGFEVPSYRDLLFEDFDAPGFTFAGAGWTTGATTGSDEWTLSNSVSVSGSSAHVPVSTEEIFSYLESPAIAVPDTNDPIFLSFEHLWDFEITLSGSHAGEDAALLMMSVDGGAFEYVDQGFTGAAAGTEIVSGDYWDHVDSSNLLRYSYYTTYAWTDDSGGWQRTTVQLDPALYKNKTLRFRWCLGSQNTGTDPVEGWWIENVSLSIRDTNTPPQLDAVPSNQATVGVLYQQVISFSDADGGFPALTSLSTPGWLGFVDHGDGTGTLSGTPQAGDVGTSQVEVEADDGTATRSLRYFLNVLPSGGNQPPSMTTGALDLAILDTLYSMVVSAADPDGHLLSLEVSNLPSWLSFVDHGNGTGTLSGTPHEYTVGSLNLEFVVHDGVEGVSQTLPLQILPAPELGFTSATASVGEGEGTVTVTVTRSLNSVGPVSVEFSTTALSATAGDDFTAQSGTLNWADGESGSKTVDIAILDDNDFNEGNETFRVDLSNPGNGAVLGLNDRVTVTITENDINDPPHITLDSPGSAQVGIPSGVGLILETTATDDGTFQPLTFSWTQESGPGTATFSSPAAEDTRVTFDIDGTYVLRLTADDGGMQGIREIIVTVGGGGGPSGYQEVAGQVVMEAEVHDHSVTVDGKEWVTNTDLTGFLGAGLVTVLPNNGDNKNTGYTGGGAARLDYQVNFTTTGTYYIWVRGNSSGGGDDSVHASLNDQVIDTADRITVSNNGNWSWSRNTMDSAVATLEVPTAGLHTFNLYMREDGASVDRIILSTDNSFSPSGDGPDVSERGVRQGPDVDPGGPYTVQAGLTLSLSATVTDDGYPEIPGSTSQTWSQVSGPGTAAFVDASLEDAAVSFDVPGEYSLRLVATDGDSSTFAEVVVTVTASGPAVIVTETDAGTDVTEGGSGDSYALVLSQAPSANVTVTVSPDGQLQTDSPTVEFTPANWDQPQVVNVSAVDDAVDEGEHSGSITHSVSSGDAGYDGIVMNAVSVTITDNDAPGVLAFSVSSLSVSEGDGTAALTVTRTGGSAGSAQVNYATLDGTATAGVDYSSNSGSLTWADGDASAKSILIPLLEDVTWEGTVSLSVTLSSATGASLGSPSVVTVEITDNDLSTDGLVLHYPFEEGSGTSTTDAAGSNNGTLQNSVEWSSGKYGGAVDVDLSGGTGVFEEVTTDASVALAANSSWTAMAWVWMDAAPVNGINRIILQQSDGGGGVGRSWLAVSDGRHLYSYLGNGATESVATLNTGQWHHVAITAGGGTVTLYLDGNPVGTSSRNVEANDGIFRIGNHKDPSDDKQWDGRIDEVRLYSRVVPAPEILAISAYLPPSPPASPTGGDATAVSSSGVELSWTDQSNNEAGFNIQRSTQSNSGFSTIHLTAADVTSYTDSGLDPDTTYYYRIMATHAVGDSGYTADSATTWTEEEQYFDDAGLDHDIDPGLDSDGDGTSNEDEFIAGTNPNDVNDVFHVELSHSPSGMQVEVATDPVKYYRVSWRHSLTAGSWTPETGYEGWTPIGASQLNLNTNKEGFFRVEVSTSAFPP